MILLWIILSPIIFIIFLIIIFFVFKKRNEKKVKAILEELTSNNKEGRYVFLHRKKIWLFFIKDRKQNKEIVSFQAISNFNYLKKLQKIINIANLENWNPEMLADVIEKNELEFKENIKMIANDDYGTQKVKRGSDRGFWKGMFFGSLFF